MLCHTKHKGDQQKVLIFIFCGSKETHAYVNKGLPYGEAARVCSDKGSVLLACLCCRFAAFSPSSVADLPAKRFLSIRD